MEWRIKHGFITDEMRKELKGKEDGDKGDVNVQNNRLIATVAKARKARSSEDARAVTRACIKYLEDALGCWKNWQAAKNI